MRDKPDGSGTGRPPSLAVFGLGYVGTVSAACFAQRGHRVVGVDVNPDKVALIEAGRSPVLEEGLDGVVAEAVSAGRLRATTDVGHAIAATDIALVCVGTPSHPNGALSTAYLERVADDIGSALARARTHYTVAFRSTMLPGTCERLLVPRLERASGTTAGEDFGVCVNPEFLREGSSINDFYDPPKTVVGELDAKSGEVLAAIYEGLPGPLHRVPLAVAELTKYVDNSFHALKVSFANEIGSICADLGLDSHAVMGMFIADRKLNIAPTYLRPGFAFGGSCLPKDVRAIVHHARHRDVPVPLLDSLLPSNAAVVDRVYRLVAAAGLRRVGLFGLAFKSGTDDLRESPMVELAERLLGRGFDVRIWDDSVATSRLNGTNRAYVEEHIPHLSRLLLTSPDDVAAHAEVAVLHTSRPAAIDALCRRPAVEIVDLVRPGGADALRDRARYTGVAW
ncbi:MAG: nucleotide sugar dehydrogenase [Acidimicrobiales bacterium]